MDATLVVLLVKAGLTYGPDIVRAVQTLLAKKDPLPSDFEPFLLILEKDYTLYIDEAKARAGK